MFLHAREGHVELEGKVRDRSVGTSELLQDAASGGVRERGERSVEAGARILNHVVPYITHGLAARKRRPCGAGGRSLLATSAQFGRRSVATAVRAKRARG